MTDSAVTDSAADEFAARGSLTIKTRAVEQIAIAAARATDDVTRRSGGLRTLSRKGLPSVDVTMIGRSVRARVVVAVEWPTPVAAVAARVRDAVARDLAAYGDVVVDRVDVDVRCVISSDDTTRVK